MAFALVSDCDSRPYFIFTIIAKTPSLKPHRNMVRPPTWCDHLAPPPIPSSLTS